MNGNSYGIKVILDPGIGSLDLQSTGIWVWDWENILWIKSIFGQADIFWVF
jgi:hypothetical protein